MLPLWYVPRQRCVNETERLRNKNISEWKNNVAYQICNHNSHNEVSKYKRANSYEHKKKQPSADIIILSNILWKKIVYGGALHCNGVNNN